MTRWPAHPVIYEVNTAVWLTSLSQAAGRRLTLAEVAASGWEAVTPAGVDAVWLMGVWQRSPAGLAVARADAEAMASYRELLPDLEPEDVTGSPYCVRRYVADPMFGGPDGLAAARAALAARGVRLLLDYVPNHVAMDHPWVTGDPEVFVHGDEQDVGADPAAWAAVDGQVLAHGRDPYFPPWTDVVQLNAFAPALRAAAAETLADVAGQCDGLRCDMAMLMINRIFRQTWGDRAGPEPAEEFWPGLIGAVRSRHPDTLFVAEAYWDLEWELQQQGFDFCYDKRLYDRIVAQDASGARGHLGADPDYQSRLIRFLRTMTSRASPPASRPARNAPPPWPSPHCPAQRCGTKVSSRAAACGHRSSCRAVRRKRRIANSPTGTGGCWPSSAAACVRAPGGCSKPPGGRTTSPAATCSPGHGTVTAAVTGMWW